LSESRSSISKQYMIVGFAASMSLHDAEGVRETHYDRLLLF
jgi:hypothetical protein